MRIVDMLSEDLIISDLLGQTRDEVLSEMVGCIVARHSEVDPGQALSVLLDRERIGSTGIGEGLAIPHARVHTLAHPVACLARSAKGVDFRALDGNPTHLFLTLLAPAGAAGFHLKALARASRMLKDPAFRRALLEGRDAHAMWETLVVKDESLSTPV